MNIFKKKKRRTEKGNGYGSIGTYHFDRVPIFLKMTDNYLSLWFSYRVHYLHLLHNNNHLVLLYVNSWAALRNNKRTGSGFVTSYNSLAIKMGRKACCENLELKRGRWTPEEDKKLLDYVGKHGHRNWRLVPAKAGNVYNFSLPFFFLYQLTSVHVLDIEESKSKSRFYLLHICIYDSHLGLERCGKSCRLRWINYLKPDIKRGNFSTEEDHTIIKLHALLGNK